MCIRDSRNAAIAAVENPTSLAGYSKESTMLAKAEPQYLALVVYMPETVGNEANYRGDVVPTIEPVSYTHLDVYKRQVLRFPSVPLPQTMQ